MKIMSNIEIIGNSLLIKDNTLIIADLHIGYDEALNKQGVLVPRIQFNETMKMFKQLFAQLKGKKIQTIVVNGDLKHEFGEISQSEWRETLAVIDLLSKHCEKLVLIKGNHDTILGPIARKRNLKIVDYFCVSNICVLHGDKILKNDAVKKARTLIIGHEHPAISLREGAKVEKYKCFLLGKWKRQDLIVMPSFLPLIEGSDVRKEDLLSPYLHQSINNFKVWILGDKVYEFGKLKDIK
jgi:putative SbcD/Mre11-related phosphoesterase